MLALACTLLRTFQYFKWLVTEIDHGKSRDLRVVSRSSLHIAGEPVSGSHLPFIQSFPLGLDRKRLR